MFIRIHTQTQEHAHTEHNLSAALPAWPTDGWMECLSFLMRRRRLLGKDAGCANFKGERAL